jgi:hypothetical protein
MLRGMLQDTHNDTVSSKRVIAFVAFLLCAVAFVANLFWNYKVDAFMFDAMIYLAMVGIGATAVEKFTPHRGVENDK